MLSKEPRYCPECDKETECYTTRAIVPGTRTYKGKFLTVETVYPCEACCIAWQAWEKPMMVAPTLQADLAKVRGERVYLASKGKAKCKVKKRAPAKRLKLRLKKKGKN